MSIIASLTGVKRNNSSLTASTGVSGIVLPCKTRATSVLIAALCMLVALAMTPNLVGLQSLSDELPSSNPPPHSFASVRPSWQFTSSAPPFCRGLINTPSVSGKPVCTTEDTKDCDPELNVFGKDKQVNYLFRHHFSHLKRRGVYLDIATNHAVRDSNTFFFDKCLGWDGVCVEPNPMYHSVIRSRRSCRLVARCISMTEGERVRFAFAGVYGGIVDTNKHIVDNVTGKFNSFSRQKTSEQEVECSRADNMLQDARVRHVDMLSLDVEGHELFVLQSMNFDQVPVNVIIVELSNSTFRDIESHLLANNFSRHYVPEGAAAEVKQGFIYDDAIFVHHSVAWGQPV